VEEPRVAVIIVNWNRPHDTVTCLHSLTASEYTSWHAIVIDNASSDDSVTIIQSAFPQVTLLSTEDNLGFAGGANRGISYALTEQYPYILLLNNDTEIASDALRLLVQTAQGSPAIGILSPLILYPDGERIWFAGAYRRRWFPSITWPGYRQRLAIPSQPFRIDYATGCAMLLRRELLLEIGPLDDTYFMYWEDMDLCERARRVGWQVFLDPRAIIWHNVSASTGEHDPLKWHLLARYVPTFYQRYYRWPRLAMFVYVGGVLIQEIMRGNFQVVRPYLKGFREGWREEMARPH
jgi:GT2 family glycosyltransferase